MGNECVIPIEENPDRKLCIINVYMLTNKSGLDYCYRKCLDTIHDSIQRYKSSHMIILCGDLNGTLLLSRSNKHDVMLKDLVDEHCLSLGKNHSQNPTFYHFNGTVTSQIDYILCSDSTVLKAYSIHERHSENVSPHVQYLLALNLQYLK